MDGSQPEEAMETDQRLIPDESTFAPNHSAELILRIAEDTFWNNNDRDNWPAFQTFCDHAAAANWNEPDPAESRYQQIAGIWALDVIPDDEHATVDVSSSSSPTKAPDLEKDRKHPAVLDRQASGSNAIKAASTSATESVIISSDSAASISLKPSTSQLALDETSSLSTVNTIEQEGKILTRIRELREQGKWEESRIPRCQVPPCFSNGVRNFNKEACWVATLISKERKLKIANAKKIAYAVKRWHEKREEQEQRQIKEDQKRLRKIAKQTAVAVMAWWLEVRKVAALKQREEIEVKKKHIRKIHLKHMMDQTEEFSSRLAQGLSRSSSQNVIADVPADSDLPMDVDDEEYHTDDDESVPDDEDTISDEEGDEPDQQHDENMLMDEADAPLEDLLPPEYRDFLLKQAGTSAEEPSSSSEPPSKRLRTRSTSRRSVEEDSKDELKALMNLSSDIDGEAAVPKAVDSALDGKIRSNEAALEKIRPKGNSLSSADVVTKIPFLLRGNLREYQHVGLDWLVSLYSNKMNGILADEMGLGKTIQAIAFLAHMACEEQDWGPHLVIAPTSVMLNWELEFKRWCPGFVIKTYYGSRKQRELLRVGWTKPDNFHVCITSYKIATQDFSVFRRMPWKYVILDEAQAIKNYKSQRWTRIANFPSQRRLLLTGTPMQNSLEEVWALLHFLAPELFESLSMFQQLFNSVTAISEGRKPQDAAIVKQLHTVLRPFILRRMKSEVETQLPKKYEHILKCRLSKRQRYLYDDYMSKSKTKETLKTGNYLSVINILMQLRKVCNHPNLFEERPVLSPLVVHPFEVTFPKAVFDICKPNHFEVVSSFVKEPFTSGSAVDPLLDCDRIKSLLPPSPLIEDITFPTDVPESTSTPSAIPIPPRPVNFAEVLGDIEFKLTDLTAGVPFNGYTSKSDPNGHRVASGMTVHKGKTKRSVRGSWKRSSRPDGPLENGVKKLKTSTSNDTRISTKEFTTSVIPSRMLAVREEHNSILDFANAMKCSQRPLLSASAISQLTMKHPEDEDRPYSHGLSCVQKCVRQMVRGARHSTERPSALGGLVKQSVSAIRFIDFVDTRYWIERASVAFPAVVAPPPRLMVHDLPRHLDTVWDHLKPLASAYDRELHVVNCMRILKFPETRLIQYDCGKLQTLDRLLRELFFEGHRALIFTQMTKVLDVLEIFLTYHGYKYLRLDGSTGVEQRQVLMDRFNRDNRYFCFILSTRSGGVGVNLTGADTVIFYDSDWNPTMDAQAQDRCHRIGQTRDVHIYRLISEHSVEENIFTKATQKRFLGHLAIESGTFTTQVLKKENLKDIFGLKAEDISAVADDVNESTIESAIAKVEDVEDVEAAKKAKAEAAVDEEENDEDDDEGDELKYKAIIKYLRPVQCYGVRFSETHVLSQDVMGELEQTREDVERRQREWELDRVEAARAEKLKAEEEAKAALTVYRPLMDPKFYYNLETLEHPSEFADPMMPVFGYRNDADKENIIIDDGPLHEFITDFSKWGTLYRNAVPEPPVPSALKPKNYRNNNNKRLKKENRPVFDPSAMKQSARRKNQPSHYNFDPSVRNSRLPPHMSMSRDLYASADMPESLQAMESATGDWKTYEDWQLVMTTSVLQGLQPTVTGVPNLAPTSPELSSYVVSTVNPKYRTPKESNLRMRTIKLREEKDAQQIEYGMATAKKKRKLAGRAVEDRPLEKTPIPVPKRVAGSVQEDNNRGRTIMFRDFFNNFRNQSYGSTVTTRDSLLATRRTVASVVAPRRLDDSGPKEALDPLTMLKKRADRPVLGRSYIQSETDRWAKNFTRTVDQQGNYVELSQFRAPRPTILEQTLQSGNRLPQNYVAGPSGAASRPPSMSTLMGLNAYNQSLQRRPSFPGSSPMPNQQIPGSPLPSIGTISSQMSLHPQLAGVGGMSAANAGASVSPGAAGQPNKPQLSPALVQNLLDIIRSQSSGQQQQQQAGEGGSGGPSGAAPSTTNMLGPVDIQKLREFMEKRGLHATDQGLFSVLKGFLTKTQQAHPQHQVQLQQQQQQQQQQQLPQMQQQSPVGNAENAVAAPIALNVVAPQGVAAGNQGARLVQHQQLQLQPDYVPESKNVALPSPISASAPTAPSTPMVTPNVVHISNSQPATPTVHVMTHASMPRMNAPTTVTRHTIAGGRRGGPNVVRMPSPGVVQGMAGPRPRNALPTTIGPDGRPITAMTPAQLKQFMGAVPNPGQPNTLMTRGSDGTTYRQIPPNRARLPAEGSRLVSPNQVIGMITEPRHAVSLPLHLQSASEAKPASPANPKPSDGST